MLLASFPDDPLTFLFSFSFYLLLNIFGCCDANTTDLRGIFLFHCKKKKKKKDQMTGSTAVKNPNSNFLKIVSVIMELSAGKVLKSSNAMIFFFFSNEETEL